MMPAATMTAYVMRVAVSQDETAREIEDLEPIEPDLMDSLAGRRISIPALPMRTTLPDERRHPLKLLAAYSHCYPMKQDGQIIYVGKR